MTEREWLKCRSPTLLLKSLRYGRKERRPSRRKLQLFCCACCRRIWHLLSDERLQRAVEVAEQYADGLVTEKEARSPILLDRELVDSGSGFAVLHAVSSREHISEHAAIQSTDYAVSALASREQKREQHNQAQLLRHVFGNPFSPYSAPQSWPATLTQLANALYNGEDCGFALHDALLEAGHPELAEHFRQEQSHPKGCWVVDVVLGRA